MEGAFLLVIFGENPVGTITLGKYADIIAVNGYVLRYISLLQDVDLIIKRGKQYK